LKRHVKKPVKTFESGLIQKQI